MKKFLFLIAAFLIFSNASFADIEVVDSNSAKNAQTKIDKIGFNILNSNGIEKRTVFDYNTNKAKNAHSRFRDRQIVIYKGLYTRLSSDDEIAAVLAHEISHSVDSYNGIMRGFFSPVVYSVAPKKYEYKADKRGVDYMVNAGYNPVALIVVMSKTFPQERFDWCSSHPLATRRMMEVYEYIYKKYPEYLVNNKYKNDIFYQNFLLTSKTNREKFQEKVKKGSKKSLRYL